MPQRRIGLPEPRYACFACHDAGKHRVDAREARRALFEELDRRRRRAQIAARHAVERAEPGEEARPRVARIA